MNKLFLSLFYLLIAVAIFIYQDQLLLWFQQSKDISIYITIIAATLFALFPIIPFPLIGGLIGAMYGSLVGGFIIWFASSAASIIMFIFLRFVFQEWGLKIIKKYPRLDLLTAMFERNAFFSILIIRFIPIIPSIIVNAYCAVTRVSFLKYSIASSLGKIPALFLIAFLGHSIVTSNFEAIIISILYATMICVTIYFYSRWKKTIQPQQENK